MNVFKQSFRTEVLSKIRLHTIGSSHRFDQSFKWTRSAATEELGRYFELGTDGDRRNCRSMSDFVLCRKTRRQKKQTTENEKFLLQQNTWPKQ